ESPLEREHELQRCPQGCRCGAADRGEGETRDATDGAERAGELALDLARGLPCVGPHGLRVQRDVCTDYDPHGSPHPMPSLAASAACCSSRLSRIASHSTASRGIHSSSSLRITSAPTPVTRLMLPSATSRASMSAA